MSKYIFNVKAINIVPEAIAGAYENDVAVISAPSIDDALDQAAERWKTNKQFRFVYKYAGVEE